MEQLGETSISAVAHTFRAEELENLQAQLGKSDISSEDGTRIEREANFVDEAILKVGKRKVCSTVYQDSMRDEYFLSLKNPLFCKKLSDLRTPEERVEYIGKYFTGVRIPPEILEKYQKNEQTSRQLRDHGNALFHRKDFQDALHYYSLALMFARMQTEAGGLAYANRAAVLFELGHFEDALVDLDLALDSKYPHSRIDKLQQRKFRCRISMQKKQEEYLAIDPKLRKEMESEIQEMKNIRDEILRVKKPNPLIPTAAEFVEIKFDKRQGRHSVVNQDIGPGTALILEEPFMFTLYGQSKWDTGHCHQCLKRIWRGIPCESCVFAIYCSESCRTEANMIHHYECSCLPSFHAMHAADQLLLAIRIILKVGSKEIFRLFQTKDPAYFNAKQPVGTEPNRLYNSNSYHKVFHLTKHSDKLHPMNLAINVQHALIATSVLEKETNFFEEVPAQSKMEFKNFVAALVLRHIEASPINAASAIELVGLENVSFTDSYSGKIPAHKLAKIMECVKFRKLAPAFYPLFSLINHSCDPNVYYLNHTTNGTMVVVAHRALKEGEPLLIAYTQDFITGEISTRQAYLARQHHFTCHCVACEMKWPTLVNIPKPKFCCPACSKTFFEYEKGSNEYRKCLLAAATWKCGRCDASYTSAELNMWLNTADDLSFDILRLFQLNRSRQAYKLFPGLLSFLQYHTFPPNGRLYVTQNLYMRTLAVILHYAAEC